MQDKDMPNRTANKSKAEGERWQSDDQSIEQRDREHPGQTRGHSGVDHPPGVERESGDTRESAAGRTTSGVGDSTTERKEVE